jgi:hypothetical protein
MALTRDEWQSRVTCPAFMITKTLTPFSGVKPFMIMEIEGSGCCGPEARPAIVAPRGTDHRRAYPASAEPPVARRMRSVSRSISVCVPPALPYSCW